ncbi:MAG TPA: bifunctional 5,10-methylenetetrahydrofolate dehydrogenase/5,10-methenyltetrahydrofolate cyclohydrolase [Candidatus Paceibacterota bacterium]|nr:bifunctional 5,10-methylenetetrahydrofolate dehydrogenase/5,10-methenyltetrahydrofolate cyclohydrolase [Candidatus Paceibacterota bacterium]
MIIDGKAIAQGVVRRLSALPRPQKFFGAALVGDDPASVNFLKQKERVAKELGVEFRLYHLSDSMTTDDLRREIGRLAEPKNCGGFIVQLPLPERVNRHYVLNAIPKDKDADCLGEPALGAFYTERGTVAPPSVGVVEQILQLEHMNLREKKVVMVGAGFLIGKPIGFWLQNRVSELVVLDVHVKNLDEKLRDADIVISGAGHAGLFGAKQLKEGALVIDFGFNQHDGKIMGDFDSEGAEDRRISYTKTPGGTGPILVAELFDNFYKLNG